LIIYCVFENLNVPL